MEIIVTSSNSIYDKLIISICTNKCIKYSIESVLKPSLKDKSLSISGNSAVVSFLVRKYSSLNEATLSKLLNYMELGLPFDEDLKQDFASNKLGFLCVDIEVRQKRFSQEFAKHVDFDEGGGSNVIINKSPKESMKHIVHPFVKRYIIKNIDKQLIGTTVKVGGWQKTLRQSGEAFYFLELNDGSCVGNLQIIVDKSVEGFDESKKALAGSSFLVEGLVKESPAKGQEVEVVASKVQVLGGSDDRYPLGKGRVSMEVLRTLPHLRCRSNLIGAIARVRNSLAFATHEFFNSNGFLYIHTPIITTSDCEGAGELFAVTTLLKDQVKDIKVTKDNKGTLDYKEDFFGQKTMLTVSGQLDVEKFCVGLSDVYTFGPTFRAEDSHTQKHLAEFWMIEPEMAFCDFSQLIRLAVEYVKYCIRYVLDHNKDDLEFFTKQLDKTLLTRLEAVGNSQFKEIKYSECIEILKKSKKKFENKPEQGNDLNTEHEKYLVEHFQLPVIVTHWPTDLKSFYMKKAKGGDTVEAFDMLVPGCGELIGGSMREDDLGELEARIKKNGLPMAEYKQYLDLRRYGSVPHGGFGLGFERLMMYVTAVENIREVIPFPRWPNNAV